MRINRKRRSMEGEGAPPPSSLHLSLFILISPPPPFSASLSRPDRLLPLEITILMIIAPSLLMVAPSLLTVSKDLKVTSSFFPHLRSSFSSPGVSSLYHFIILILGFLSLSSHHSLGSHFFPPVAEALTKAREAHDDVHIVFKGFHETSTLSLSVPFSLSHFLRD